MTVEEALFTRLTGAAGLAVLVGARVYPEPLPQNDDLPAVSYRRVSAQRESVMGRDTGIVRARFQTDAWSTTATEARAVGKQVRLALQRWAQPSDPVVQDTFLLNEQDLFEDESKTHRFMQDFEVIYVEELV